MLERSDVVDADAPQAMREPIEDSHFQEYADNSSAVKLDGIADIKLASSFTHVSPMGVLRIPLTCVPHACAASPMCVQLHPCAPHVYIPQSHGFSGGWKTFAVDNDLAAGDEVIFEVIDQERMKVYIFRHKDYASGAGPLPELYEDAPEVDYKGRANITQISGRKVGEQCRGIKRELMEGASPKSAKKDNTAKLSQVVEKESMEKLGKAGAKMKAARRASKEQEGRTDADHAVIKKKVPKRKRRLTEVGGAKASLPKVRKMSRTAPASPCPSGTSKEQEGRADADHAVTKKKVPERKRRLTEVGGAKASLPKTEVVEPQVIEDEPGCSPMEEDAHEQAQTEVVEPAVVDDEPGCSPMEEDAQEQAQVEASVQPLRENLGGCGRTVEEPEFSIHPCVLIADLLEQQEKLRSGCLIVENKQIMNACVVQGKAARWHGTGGSDLATSSVSHGYVHI
eukprot:gene17143-23448_t